MSKARDLADLMSTGGILEDGALSTSEIVNVTAAPEELNLLDGATVTTDELNKLDGVTATTAELNKLAGTTATTSDFDKLSNVTASATELNYMTGATSSIQSQLDNISVTSGSLTKSFTNGESATITLAQSITPAPVVSVTKEVAQTGQSSKGAWDVNATASNYDLHNTAYDTTLTKSTITSGTAYGTTAATGGTSSTFTITAFNDIRGINFSTDGTKMVALWQNNVTLRDYTLSTAWDVSTATYNGTQGQLATSFSGNGIGMDWKPDGYKVWIPDFGNGNIREFTANTPFNTSSLGSIQSYNFGNADFLDIVWKPDGTKVYFVSYSAGSVHQFTCSTPWSLSTASGEVTYNVPSRSQFLSVDASHDGTALYIGTHNSSFHIVKVSMSTAWDLSTASDSIHLVTQSGAGNFGIIKYEDEGRRYYWNDYSGNVINYAETVASSTGLVLGTGSFASTDVGKRIQGNGGDVILTSTAGAYDTTGGSDFTDTSTIASGSWTMHGLKSAGDDDGLTIAGNVSTAFSVNKLDVFNDGSCLSCLTFEDATLTDLNSSNTVVGTHNRSSVSKFGNYSIHIPNGNTTYYAAVQDLNFTGGSGNASYTISAWFNITNLRMGINPIVCMTTNFDNNATGMITVAGNGQFGKGTTGSTSLQTGYVSSATVQAGTWYHGVATFDYGTGVYKMYLDGVEVLSVSGATSEVQLDNGTAVDYLIGHEPDSFNPYGAFDGNQNIDGYIDQVRIFNRALSSSEINTIYSELDLSVLKVPTSSYHIGVTNASGQIDSSFWTDINSMTADQSLGDGEVYYAVSTDDRTTWSVAKGSDGVRPIVRDNAGTWQYNSDAGTSSTSSYSMSSASYDSKSFSVTSQTGSIRETHFNNTGTRMFVISDSSNKVWQYDLSTAFDVSTASYNSVNLNIANESTGAQGFTFNNDGTKMYVTGEIYDTVFQYNLSTAFDLSTATYANKSLSLSGVQGVPGTIVFNDDGTKLFVCGEGLDIVAQYNLTTAYDVSTGSYASISYNHSAQTTSVTSMAFNDDGTKMFLASRDNESVIYQYSLPTAYDIANATYDGVSFNVAPQLSATFQGIVFNNDGSKLYVTDNSGVVLQYTSGGTVYSYSTSTTWTDATTNDEFYALQEALGETEFNRMDKTQLDAVADGSHFTLGDTLDLMIALKQDTASASLPTSDGVSINYDAEALNQGAVLGTDYDFDFPANNKVRITSNAAQNLKIRVV